MARNGVVLTRVWSSGSVAYEAGDRSAWKIVGTPGMSTQLVFDFFDIRQDLDEVKIYKCETPFCDDVTQLAVGSGAYNPFAITSSTGASFALRVVFVPPSSRPAI